MLDIVVKKNTVGKDTVGLFNEGVLLTLDNTEDCYVVVEYNERDTKLLKLGNGSVSDYEYLNDFEFAGYQTRVKVYLDKLYLLNNDAPVRGVTTISRNDLRKIKERLKEIDN